MTSGSVQIVIFGAGGHAKVVLDALGLACPQLRPIILDDSPSARDASLNGLSISGTREWLSTADPSVGVIPAIGQNSARAEFISWLEERGRRPMSLVHPAAVVSATAVLADGVFVAACGVVNAEARIGEGAIVNTCASVDHDCLIGASAHIAPGAHVCGGVSVGPRTLVGAGATVIPKVRIGSDVVIGAGAVVVSDVPDGTRVVGCPAKPI